LKEEASKKYISEFFHSFKCGSPVFPAENGFGGVVSISENETISDALKKLTEFRILSMPVVDSSGKVVSVCSITHILHRFLQLFTEEEVTSKNLMDLMEKKIALREERLGDVLKRHQAEFESLDPICSLPTTADLMAAVKCMQKHKAHRVVIYDEKENHKLSNIITESRVLQFLNVMLDFIPKVELSVEEAGVFTPKEVVTVKESDKAIKAFKLMIEKKVSGVGVVDGKGSLTASISVADLKMVGYDLGFFGRMLKWTVAEYLDEVVKNSSLRSPVFKLLHDLTEHQQVVKCQPGFKFGYVIKIANFYRVHRVFVVDEFNKPIGVITLSDILRELVRDIE